jgi:flagellar biosynthetic protein FliQ
MEQLYVVDMIQRLVWLILLLTMPMLVVTLLVGVIISIFQAVTQIQESTLTFVPKIIVALMVIVFLSPWMIGTMVDYTTELFGELTKVAQMRT